jgi:hypothetical protein
MTYNEKRQYIKNNALNKILKIYNGNFYGDRYASESIAEQQSYEVQNILTIMKKELLILKLSKQIKDSK